MKSMVVFILTLFMVDANSQVYVIPENAPLSAPKLIAKNIYAFWLDISPDGKRIMADGSTASHDFAAFETSVSGGTWKQVTANGIGDVFTPAYAPDGKSILYVVDKPIATIYQLDQKTGNLRQLIQPGLMPRLSADGKRVVFSRQTQAKVSMFIANYDGTGEIEVSQAGNWVNCPTFHPRDSNEILYTDSTAIYQIRADGSNIRTLLKVGYIDCVRWSPDGSKVVYSSTIQGKEEIFVMKADGSGSTRMTAVANMSASNPVFSPDGQKIYFILSPVSPLTKLDLMKRNASGISISR